MNLPETQFVRFHDGGFALHQLTDPSFAGHASAWYDKDGNLLDFEQFNRHGRVTKSGARILPALEKAGRIHKPVSAA